LFLHESMSALAFHDDIDSDCIAAFPAFNPLLKAPLHG
jgi:hypothetical protein